MINDINKTAKEKMGKSMDNLHAELDTLKAGRANPRMLDRIEVEYYGSMVPLNQVGNISVPEARMMVITPWEKPMLKNIERAILKSDLGINPVNDGKAIRLVIAELTEETRKNIVKQVKKYGEDSKIAIRSIRRDANDKIKALKDEGVPEDDVKRGEEDIQKLTDQYIANIDKAVEEKEEEVMTI
ncbi:MAG: ribosome recycling factor [Clostridium sp.]|jgi:ribosome recycling factor|nr:ribosome recycling factor [Clostridium sp.]